ncbi:uncharacterized protein LOC111679120 [Lucilia cuprina]|uniref:uncharacterized protein LOC111679120 n=1 Tax=Lucilia cuprina TaxID=7375 RepID=UPI001F05FC5C|nr:uncharacterized protein LOC111679120 [Lucilia cuprina]
MGNVCSSGQSKKKDSISEKSDDSYNINKNDQQTDNVNDNSDQRKAPLADPENVPDITNNESAVIVKGNDLIDSRNGEKLSSANKKESSESATVTAPNTEPNTAQADVSDSKNTSTTYLSILQGKPLPGRKIERNKKIVIYILADNSPEYKKHKRVVYSLHKQLAKKCQSKGFEMFISDVHNVDAGNRVSNYSRLMEASRWTHSPLEAQGGHEEAANCLSEITRHTSSAYVIPILFLGSSLGIPMLPLTIESQDFTQVLTAANEDEKVLLEKWYIIDNCYQPMCHRLNTELCKNYSAAQDDELNLLLGVLLRLFSDDLKDSYMSTVVEQEVNNTVLMSQELAKRCIWIQTGPQYMKAPENATAYDHEVLRRMSKLYTELKSHLSEKNLIRILPTMNILDDELAVVIENLLEKSIASIFEEHVTKNNIPYNTNGVDHALLEEIELVGHYSKILAQNSPNFDIMNDIKRYIKDSTAHPLVVSGPSGCGKSVFISKIVENIHRWKPELNLVLRYANLGVRSSDLVSVLGSIASQMSILAHGHQIKMEHTIENYSKVIQDVIKSTKCFFVIIIDSVDDIMDGINLEWLPINLSNMCKIILTLTENNNEENPLIEKLIETGIPNRCFIKMKQFSERQWQDILSSGGGDFYAANGAIKMPQEWKMLHGKTPFHAKSLWWLAWLGHTSISMTDISEMLGKILQVMESKFSSDHSEIMMLILSLSEWGIRESDCIDIFHRISQIDAQVAFRVWSKFCWLMGPMLLTIRNIRIADKSFRNAILSRYKSKHAHVHQIIREYFDRQENYFTGLKEIVPIYNYQKFLKLPYHHFCNVMEDHLGLNKVEILFHCFYFTELQWMADKVHATGPAHLMSDVLISEKISGTSDQPYVHIRLLKDFLKKYMHELNYDGHQFFTLIKFYMKSRIREDPSLNDDQIIRSWLECTNELEIPFLDIINTNFGDELQTGKISYDVIVNLPHPGFFVASISTEREEICIWDVKSCSRVRILKGIPQPTAMCPFGTYNAAVLCRREIKVINLDDGKFKVALKGVMNQKMPYFGLHDQKHLVCLSRNRMYVNLMNLDSGDCVTTFKAGEDRFLNSLLVSGDGRILVCGDETQKPFPLLVWHLTQRKLLYDLRIPHHDFITSLSAITHEGSYVCVVAKELNEPTPNFIVVYDLQSGTLFKKWKPTCNTVSLAISQVNACVIAGLEDAKILIWDLVTGNCRSTLIGHNAPVTSLKIDPMGKVLMSTDKEGRDNALRLWELSTGKSLAVFKPPGQISACEVLPNCTYIIVALTNKTELLTLSLNNFAMDLTPDDSLYVLYGNQDNQNKVFQLNSEPN